MKFVVIAKDALYTHVKFEYKLRVLCADLLRLWSPSAYWKACELDKAGQMASYKNKIFHTLVSDPSRNCVQRRGLALPRMFVLWGPLYKMLCIVLLVQNVILRLVLRKRLVSFVPWGYNK